MRVDSLDRVEGIATLLYLYLGRLIASNSIIGRYFNIYQVFYVKCSGGGDGEQNCQAFARVLKLLIAFEESWHLNPSPYGYIIRVG